MLKSVSAQQIKRLDHRAIHHFGIPSIVLMENAGRAVADEVLKLLKKKKRVCIVCGVGNNAGDGFVAARHLIARGIKCTIILIGAPGQLKNDAAINYQILKNLKLINVGASGRSPLQSVLKNTDIIVDAIFGFGLNRTIGDPYTSSIEAINQSGKPVVAVDIPSGLDATTGQIHGVCVKAHTTVTFTLPKKGFYIREGKKVTGRIVIKDIGVPIRSDKSGRVVKW